MVTVLWTFGMEIVAKLVAALLIFNDKSLSAYDRVGRDWYFMKFLCIFKYIVSR